MDFAYRDDGLSSKTTRYADLAGENMVAATDQAFDAMGRVESITHKQADEVFADYTYEWDATSRITEIDMDFDGTSYDDTATYSYDDTSQLTDADYISQTDEDYSWDATGNQNNTGYSTGDHNRLSTDGTYNYTWDNEGNLVRQTNISTGEYVENTWDHRNRLVKVTNYNASDVATQIVEYAYDANNRMYKRILDSDGNGTLNMATVFVRCDDHIVMELERSDATAMTVSDLKTRHLWHPTQIDHHLAQENISPAKTLWTLPDHLNTVRDVVEYIQATGAVNILNHITYDSFGDIVAQSDSGITLVSYYTGRYHDFATGNRYHRERWTRPSIRIWLSEDPISFAAGDVNLYRYVGNCAVVFLDADGLEERPGGISVDPGVDWLHPPVEWPLGGSVVPPELGEGYISLQFTLEAKLTQYDADALYDRYCGWIYLEGRLVPMPALTETEPKGSRWFPPRLVWRGIEFSLGDIKDSGGCKGLLFHYKGKLNYLGREDDLTLDGGLGLAPTWGTPATLDPSGYNSFDDMLQRVDEILKGTRFEGPGGYFRNEWKF